MQPQHRSSSAPGEHLSSNQIPPSRSRHRDLATELALATELIASRSETSAPLETTAIEAASIISRTRPARHWRSEVSARQTGRITPREVRQARLLQTARV
ncbi:hypothetical protein ANO11243_026750 [Dothideomycetidae sp. 11243]|nr:hypothetical protein ANO11243_026750 [fungal sp. No.11243]